jgi:hypothetical protein
LRCGRLVVLNTLLGPEGTTTVVFSETMSAALWGGGWLPGMAWPRIPAFDVRDLEGFLAGGVWCGVVGCGLVVC